MKPHFCAYYDQLWLFYKNQFPNLVSLKKSEKTHVQFLRFFIINKKGYIHLGWVSNKPVCLALSVVDISKIEIYKLWHWDIRKNMVIELSSSIVSYWHRYPDKSYKNKRFLQKILKIIQKEGLPHQIMALKDLYW